MATSDIREPAAVDSRPAPPKEIDPEWSKKQGGRLSYGEPERVSGPLIPIFEMNAATKRLAWLIFEPLVERKKLGAGVRCRLCEDYTSSDRQITFRLKKGVSWHDGVPLSAQDVAFTYGAVGFPGNSTPLGRVWSDLIESVTVEDKWTVSFRFRRPVRLPETYFQSLPILPWHKFTVLQPSLLEEPNLGMVRVARVQVAVFRAADDAQPAGWNIEAGVQLSVMRLEQDWAEVKVIAGGPEGKSGWIRQHRVQLNEKDDAKLMTQAVGTGPYKLESFLKDDMVSLVRFEDYHGKKPYIAEIRWARTQSNPTTQQPVDLIPDAAVEDLTRLRAKAGDEWNLVFYPSLKISGFLYNCRKDPLAKKEFRRALTHATNRSRWLDDYLQQHGFLIASAAPPDSPLYDPKTSPLAWDVAKAKALKSQSAGTSRVGLKLIVPESLRQGDKSTVQAYKRAVAALGVVVDVMTLDPQEFDQALRNGDFDVAFQEVALTWTEDYRPLFASGGAHNYGHYQNSELDKVFVEWAAEADFEKVRALASKSQQILAEDCPWTFLWSSKNVAAARPKIRGIRAETLDPDRFFAWIQEWWIPEEHR